MDLKFKKFPLSPAALYIALDRYDNAALEKSLAMGGKVQYADKFGNTPLHLATSATVAMFVPALLKLGADPNAISTTTGSPLAVLTSRYFKSEDMRLLVQATKALLKYGAQVDVPDPDGMTPLMHAARRGYTQVAKLLITAGSDVNARDKRAGLTVLMYAQSPRMVKFVLEHGADPSQRNKSKQTAAEYFKDEGDNNLARAIEAHGAKSTRPAAKPAKKAKTANKKSK